MRRGRSEGLEKREMLRRIREMILPADDMRNSHFQIIDDVHEMKHRLAVAAKDHKIRIDPLAIG